MANNIPQFTRSEDFSLTHYVAKNYAEWESTTSGIKSFCARPLAAISMPVTGAIDLVAHAVLALVKAPVAVVIAMPWSFVATVFNTRSPPPDIKITSVFVHLYATVHSTLCGITLPFIILLCPNKAARLSSRSQQDLINAGNQNVVNPIQGNQNQADAVQALRAQHETEMNDLLRDRQIASLRLITEHGNTVHELNNYHDNIQLGLIEEHDAHVMSLLEQIRQLREAMGAQQPPPSNTDNNGGAENGQGSLVPPPPTESAPPPPPPPLPPRSISPLRQPTASSSSASSSSNAASASESNDNDHLAAIRNGFRNARNRLREITPQVENMSGSYEAYLEQPVWSTDEQVNLNQMLRSLRENGHYSLRKIENKLIQYSGFLDSYLEKKVTEFKANNDSSLIGSSIYHPNDTVDAGWASIDPNIKDMASEICGNSNLLRKHELSKRLFQYTHLCIGKLKDACDEARRNNPNNALDMVQTAMDNRRQAHASDSDSGSDNDSVNDSDWDV